MSGIHRFLTRRDRQKGAGRHGKEEVCFFSHLHLALVLFDDFEYKFTNVAYYTEPFYSSCASTTRLLCFAGD